jgi:hypothetical protein
MMDPTALVTEYLVTAMAATYDVVAFHTGYPVEAVRASYRVGLSGSDAIDPRTTYRCCQDYPACYRQHHRYCYHK